MRKKRQTFKGHSFSLRVPEKVRYGLDLLANKHHSQMSALVMRAIEMLFEDEGLTTREPGQLFSLMDRLWAEDEVERLRSLMTHAPGLASTQDKEKVKFLDSLEQSANWETFFQRSMYCVEVDFGDKALNDIISRTPWLKERFKNTRELLDEFKAEQHRHGFDLL